MKEGDIVRAHIQVQSKQQSGEVQKLSYRSRGPFVIVRDVGHGSFDVRPYKQPNAATRRYKGVDLYPLPPSIFPTELIDTIDQRYLNYEHSPIVSPLKKVLDVESYNHQWFHNKPKTAKGKSTDPTTPFIDTVQADAIMTSLIPSQKEMDKTIGVKEGEDPGACEIFEEEIHQSLHIPTLKHQISTEGGDKLFFIRFIPAETIRPKWYLVQIDLELTAKDPTCNPDEGIFNCAFLAKHPNDLKKSDERARWWPDWYKYSLCEDTGEIIYGQRTLIRPSTIPDSRQYVLWSTAVNLNNHETFIHGPFNFAELNQTNRTRNTVHRSDWTVLFEYCKKHSIMPPTLGANSQNVPCINRKKRKKPE